MSVTPSMSGLGGGDACPNCGEPMEADQRYCLNCGHRRGEPRLPFMDAVTFMESMSAPGGTGTPPPPPPSPGPSSRWNANAALIAGVATLVLAIGVGFLIGRSGHENGSQAAAAPQVIKVEGGEGGGGGSETGTVAPTEETEPTAKTGKKSASKNKSKNNGEAAAKKKASEIEAGSKEEEERAKAKTDEALHTKEGIELETEVEVGGKCKQGTAGCTNGKFEGEFFE